MARITVEDCIDKVDSPYELVMVAKERAVQLNAGVAVTVDPDNDKNTVISLREISEEKIKVKDLEDSAIYKLRKHVDKTDDNQDEDEVVGDDFENLYKGEVSKSGVPILPSKRARKVPEKIQVSKLDVDELKNENNEVTNAELDTPEVSPASDQEESLEALQEEESLDNETSDNEVNN